MAEPMWSCSFDGGVRLRMGETGIAAAPPVTVMEFLETVCAKVPDHPALAVEEAGGWKFTTYKVRARQKGDYRLPVLLEKSSK
jgi:uncharacterized protein (DUF58 family)